MLQLTETMSAVVSDFGFAREVSNVTDIAKTTSEIGPVKWMVIVLHLSPSQAPESLSSQIYSAKSDVWSFAITVWEIVTRSEPYLEQSLTATAILVAAGKAKSFMTFPPTCPKRLGELAHRCLEMEPEKRPTFQEMYLLCVL